MLNHLQVENFKTWKNLSIEFSSVTALFGANSSGKSSVIQFLLLLKQTKEATDRGLSLDFNGTYVKLGDYKDIVFDHDINREFLGNLEWNLMTH